MKSFFTVIISIIFLVNAAAQSNWIQIADYGGGPCSFTSGGVVNGKGYIPCNNQMWEYDPVADQWNQKAAFPGSARVGSVAFAIDSNLYFGTGNILFGPIVSDWWKYNAYTDNWSQLNDFPGPERYAAVGFSIGSKGYITTGFTTGFIYNNDIWEYEPSNDSWTQLTAMPDVGRYLAAGFAVDGMGYVVTGYESTGDVKDVWQYDPGADTWTQKNDFTGEARRQAAGFASAISGYLATGGNDNALLYDAWEYDPIADFWKQLPDFTGGGRRSAVGFCIDDYAFLGIGFIPSGITYQDFWKLQIDLETNYHVTEIQYPLSVYPNPGHDYFLAGNMPQLQEGELKITNCFGQLADVPIFLEKGTASFYYNASNLTAGLYMISFQTKESTYSVNWMKLD